ncbi:MAG: class I SAM-dependent methyltransferase [Bacteroidales bacterium]|nr:class I SAM-dependent methyltransferase [Bacteroidales bacterium]
MSKFNKIIGYAENVEVDDSVLLKKSNFLKELLKDVLPEQKFGNIFVAGCGNGKEATALQRVFKQQVTGVDINLPKSNVVRDDKLNLFIADLNNLPIDDNSFSFIYCYHVLEHVENPLLVLQELKRILSPNGVIFIGFPNRNRLTPSYLNSNLKIGILKIINYNARDYWYKITGRFKNEYGAHAGFSEKEFLRLALPIYRKVIPIRSKWVEYNYSKYYKIFKITKRLRLDDLLYPSNYYLLKI